MYHRILKHANECFVVGSDGKILCEQADVVMFAHKIVQDCISEIALTGMINYADSPVAEMSLVMVENIREKFDMK